MKDSELLISNGNIFLGLLCGVNLICKLNHFGYTILSSEINSPMICIELVSSISNDIIQVDMVGNSSIGLFSLATDNYVILPLGTKQEVQEQVEANLRVPSVKTSLAGTVLIGTFCAGNENGLLVPNIITDQELETLKNNLPEISITEIDHKYTALGNIIVSNKKYALVHPKLSKEIMQNISDALMVEVIPREINGSPLVGSFAVSSHKATLVHPLTPPEEIDWLRENYSKIIDVTTVNRGVPYPRSGLLINSNGGVVGTDTTGPESMRIFDVMFKRT